MQIQYQARSVYGEKQIQYYRKTNPYKLWIAVLKWFCYLVGGFSVFINMIFFMTAAFSPLWILNAIWFLVGVFLLVDGAMGSLWLNKQYEKRIKKREKDGMIVLSFYEEQIEVVYEAYHRNEIISYEQIKKVLQDFEGYYLFTEQDIFYVRRKKFEVGDGYEFPRFIEQKARIKVEKQ